MSADLDEAPDFGAGYVIKGQIGGYFVQSRTTSGVWYLVSGRTCSCKAGRAGRVSCFHRQQVEKFVAKLNEKMKRPRAADTGEDVVTRFVD